MATGALRIVAPADGMVDKHPIQDLTALAYSDAAKTLYLLDRSGAVYGWDMAARWWLEREAGNNSDTSQEYPVALAADSNRVYLLDTNNGSIWRRTDGAGRPSSPVPSLRVASGSWPMRRPLHPGRRAPEAAGAPAAPAWRQPSAIDVQGGMEQPTAWRWPAGRATASRRPGLPPRARDPARQWQRLRRAMRLTLPDAASEVHRSAYGAEGIVVLGRTICTSVPAASRLWLGRCAGGAIPRRGRSCPTIWLCWPGCRIAHAHPRRTPARHRPLAAWRAAPLPLRHSRRHRHVCQHRGRQRDQGHAGAAPPPTAW